MDKKYSVRGCEINEANLSLQETLFHNANGYIGVRGTLEEGCPKEFDTMRGMYINGFYDIAPMKQAEKLCNLVEDKETMLNAVDTQTINLFFGEQEFSMFEGLVEDYERVLDMESGVTIRKLKWTMPEGKKIDFSIQRMASFEEKTLFTIDYEFCSVDYEGEVKIISRQKGLVQNYFNPNDPRLAGESHTHLRRKDARIEGARSYLASETVKSGLTVSSGVAHELYVNGKLMPEAQISYDLETHQAQAVYQIELHPGDLVRLVKYTVLCDSVRFKDCMKSTAEKLDQTRKNGIGFYYGKQKEYLEKFWESSELEIDGDDDLNLSVSFNMYQLLQSAGTDGYSSIAAKGMSGEGYEGHYFWDTEMFMLPYFVLTNPKIARELLHYRYMILPKARENAGLLGHVKGALYPWRTITGTECSGYYPSGTAQYHINGDIAYAVALYYHASGDWEFMKEEGLEILLETARLWMDTGDFHEGKFHINCVTGPDEYTCMVNNNYYTNASARYNLEQFLLLVGKLKQESEAWKQFSTCHGITEEELAEMGQAAEKMYLPYDENLKINPQDDSFLQKPVWDLATTKKEDFPLLLHYHPLHLYRYQVCKQADTVLAHFLFPDYQSRETVENSFYYYEKITTHDSSLSTCVFSIVASLLGLKEKATEYFGDSAKMDLMNTHGNTKDGIHAANMGGCYMAIIYGFAGLRIKEDEISLAPYVPGAWKGYRFRFRYRGQLLRVCTGEGSVSIELMEGSGLTINIYDKPQTLVAGETVTLEMER